MLLLKLESGSSVPAYLQIRDRIVEMIDDGTLQPGDRLPPTRELAVATGVHRSTVVRAYEEVRALGCLESRAGSYTTVRRRARPPGRDAAATNGIDRIDWDGLIGDRKIIDAEAATSWTSAGVGDRAIDFERLAADPSLAPTDDLRRCIKAAMIHRGAETLDYAEPAGSSSFRETVSRRLRAHGVAVCRDEILITNGAQQGLDLVLRLLVGAGDRVAVEAPTYAMFHPLLRLHGGEPVEVAMTGGGMDLDCLERVMEKTALKLVYTMPNFHNPTGVTTGQPHRERLLELCESRRVPILEDGFEEEMKYFGRAVLPIKSMDRQGLVVYVGSFSKVVFPGLRVGWIAAPAGLVARLTGIQHATCLATDSLAQAAADLFSRRGEFEIYLRRIHRVYRRRMGLMLDGLARLLPAGVEWSKPAGGYTIWLTLPQPVDEEPRLCGELRRAGVKVASGRRFFAAPPSRAHLRLSIACVDEGLIEEGCRRLGSVLAAALS